MSSSSEPNTESLKAILHGEQASLDRPSQKSSPAKATSPSKSSRKLPPFSDAESMNSLSLVLCELTKLSSNDAQMRRKVISSTRERSSQPSMKQTKYDTVVPVGQKPWIVELHREVGKDVAGYGLCDPSFSPTLGELVSALEANPKQFAKKNGKLKNARAADLKFKNVTYRAVFILNEAARRVFVLTLDAHDAAYDVAIRRSRAKKRS
jgi:hypothetical protein